jgi:hypothetical protein
MKLQEIVEDLDLEDLKLKLEKGCRLIVAANYSHDHYLADPLPFEVEKDEEGQIIEIMPENDGAYRYFIGEVSIDPEKLNPIGRYRFKVLFGNDVGEYSWDILRDPGYCVSRGDFKTIEKILRLKRIEYPENPKQLRFNF